MSDAENQEFTGLDIDPKDLEDPVLPEGKYEAVVSRVSGFVNKPDAKYNAGHRMVRVEYRVRDSDPEIDGKPVKPFPMSIEPGDNYRWRQWLEALGVNTSNPGHIDFADFVETDVVIEVSQKRSGDRVFMQVNNVQQA